MTGRVRTARTSWFLLALAALFIAGAVSGCGGSGGSNESASSTSGGGTTAGATTSTAPTGAKHDPATTYLDQAGLAVCSEGTRDFPPSVTDLPGMSAARGFYVANGSCKGVKVTPNFIGAFAFSSPESFNSGEAAIKTASPNGAVYGTYPLVILSTGPAKDENLDALKKYLPAPRDTGTGTVSG